MRSRLRRLPYLLALLTLPTIAAAQDTTAVKALAKRDSVDAVKAYNATRSSTVRGAMDRVKARTDSIYRAMRKKDSTIVVTPPPPPPPPPVVQTARIELKPSTGTLSVGQTLAFIALPKDATGANIPAAVSWSASPSTVGTISGLGVLSAKGAGTVTVTARADTASRSATITVTDTAVVVVKPDSTPSQPPPPPPPSTPPGPVIFSHPFASPANGAVLAELPRDTVDVSPPAVVRIIRTTNAQAALDTARTGDQIRVAPGTTTPNVIARPNPRWTGWVELRTDIADSLLGGPWERMTDAKSVALRLATLTTFTTDPALLVTSGTRYLRVTGMRITNQFSGINAVVVVGQAENDTAKIPHSITFDRTVIQCGNANHTRRGLRFDAIREAFVSGSILACRDSGGGDSQGILVINTNGPGRIENNTIQGGHQSLFFGGGSPAAPNVLPRDFVIRRNDFCRPATWLRGGSEGKALVEWKMGERHLFEGNVVCHMDASGQYGYAFNVKSEDQNGLAPWTASRDITFRYNKLSCVVAGWSVFAAPGTFPTQPAQRITIYNNVATDSIATAPCAGPYDALTLGGVRDVVFMNNHIRNVGGRSAIYFMGQNPNLVATDNVLGGEYGLKGDAVAWQNLAPNSLVTRNTLLGNQPLSAYPAVARDSTRDALLQGVQVAP